MAVMFLCVHILMLLVFIDQKCDFLIYSNVFSIVFYAGMFFVIARHQYMVFVVATYVEVCLHMGLVLCLTGWGGGFQVALIAICILLAFAEYIGRTMKIKHAKSIFLFPVAMVIYIGSLILSLNVKPLYTLSDSVVSFFEIVWAVIVFVTMSLVLEMFVIVTTRSQEALSFEATHDELTGLPNRFYMTDYFRKLKGAGDKECYWLAIADIDDFKSINDTYGHVCGDYVLKKIAEQLRMASTGLEICRWGGEEFLIVGHQDISDPAKDLEIIRKTIAEYVFTYENNQLPVTVTIGVAGFSDELSIKKWISAADEKLYEGKTSGKNKVCI